MQKLIYNSLSKIIILSLCVSCTQKESGSKSSKKPNGEAPQGMVWIPGGEFIMGTDDTNSYARERPAHRVRIDGFWMDETEVTNKQFSKFVKSTGYVTIAERKPTWEELKSQLPPGIEKPADSLFVAGSMVFDPMENISGLDDISQWWSWTPRADWRHPDGPESNIEGLDNHPVVHVAIEDAKAYCKWAGKRLPTEAEWEFACRGGVEGQRYSWGEELQPDGQYMANTFQGVFPLKNTSDDGFTSSSPVKSYPSNPYGLYDMIGNVWEWTSDLYHEQYYSHLASEGLAINPKGPYVSFNPTDPYGSKHVTKGGSYLCADNYCVNYRSSARQGTAFDSGTSNIGFRCVKAK